MTLRFIVWLVTAKCNLSCAHCYASRFSGLRELTTEEALALIREASELGVAHINFTGGEPLLRGDIVTLMEEARDLAVGVSMVTNGTVVTERVAERLARLNVYAYVSLDGPRREVHERLRGPGTWDRVLRGIELLREAGVDFSTVMAVCRHNASCVGEYVAKAEELGAEAACIIPVMPSGRATESLAPSPKQMLEAVLEADSASEELGYPVSVWCYAPAALYSRSKYLVVYGCRTLSVVDVDPAGNLLVCDVLDFRVSSWRELGLRRAYEAYSSAEIVRSLVSPELREPCASCPVAGACRGGCFARAYLMSGDIKAPDPLCPRVAERQGQGRSATS